MSHRHLVIRPGNFQLKFLASRRTWQKDYSGRGKKNNWILLLKLRTWNYGFQVAERGKMNSKKTQPRPQRLGLLQNFNELGQMQPRIEIDVHF